MVKLMDYVLLYQYDP